jgi:hypothetical protein
LERQANGSAEVPHVHAKEDPALTNALSDVDVHRMHVARSTLNRCALWHRASPELYDETDDAECGREPAHKANKVAPPTAPRQSSGWVPREASIQSAVNRTTASVTKGYGRPKNPVNGTFF